VTAARGTGEPHYVTAAALRERVDSLRAVPGGSVRGVVLDARDPLFAFYAARDFSPAWTRPSAINDLLETLAHADAEGLTPDDYLAGVLSALVPRPVRDVPPAVDVEILLTESLLRYATHRRFGKVDANAMLPDPLVVLPPDPAADGVAWLERALAAPSLAAFLSEDLRDPPWTERLKQALSTYRALLRAGGWPAIGPGPTLQVGDRGPRVLALRRRLAATGDLGSTPPATDAGLFDVELERALQHAQSRHGLTADGRAGRRTIGVLDVPVGARIGELRLAIERTRWIRSGLPNEFIIVNIPAFRAVLARDGQFIWESRVIVGQPRRPTPVLRAEVRSAIINPNWTVPPTIVREDVLPQLKRDVGYLDRENLKVVAADGSIVDPRSVDWSRYTRGIPYNLVQDPGPHNVLGRIKFVFPNTHTVYMHDTPAKNLFERPERAFSSGCIRVEEAPGLAGLLLANEFPDAAALDLAIASRKSRVYTADRPTPVLLVYWTAAVDPDTTLHFYRDIYALDGEALAALDSPIGVFRPRSAQRGVRRASAIHADAGP
jgi:murein L,D-transpeptidase YcbB/YkuD